MPTCPICLLGKSNIVIFAKMKKKYYQYRSN